MGSGTYVVAGNGHSVSGIADGRILADDFIIRTNNFFFEPSFFLGRRVDLAFMGGDPRVAPFMFETLYRCRSDYQLTAWSSHNPKVARAGRRRFGALFQPMVFKTAAVEQRVRELCAHYGKTPTTGIYAVLMAHALGAKTIILAGIDLYETDQRYPFTPGHHYRALMGQDLLGRGVDDRLHDPDLDRDILRWINAQDDVVVQLAAENSALGAFLDLAPLRQGPAVTEERSNPPTDWSARSGLYPIAMLKLLRLGSAFMRRLKTPR